MFDRDAVVIANQKRRVTSKYNNKAEFTNYWYKEVLSYFNDLSENAVVFLAE